MDSELKNAVKVIINARLTMSMPAELDDALTRLISTLTKQEEIIPALKEEAVTACNKLLEEKKDNRLLSSKIFELQKKIKNLKNEKQQRTQTPEKVCKPIDKKVKTLSYDGVCALCGSGSSTVYKCTDNRFRIICTNPRCKCFCRLAPVHGFETLKDIYKPSESKLFTVDEITIEQYYS